MIKLYNTKPLYAVLIFFFLLGGGCFAQNVGINSTGALPSPSAGLDIDFHNKGTLITRMTTSQRDSIAIACSCTPAEGLQIYNTSTKCFEFYLNGAWQSLTCACTSTPASAGTISGIAAVCSGQTGGYSVPAITGATSYTWSYSGTGATIVNSANTAIIYFSASATSGNLTVMGTNACGNGTVSANYTITVTSLPAAAGNISGTTSICGAQNNVSYSVPSIANATSYLWLYSGSGVTISGSTNAITINFGSGATSGNLTVIGSNACGNGTASASYAITVTASPAAAGTISGDTTVYIGQSNVTYTVPAIANATSYLWTLPSDATGSSTTNSISVSYGSSAISGNITVQGVSCSNGTSSSCPVTVYHSQSFTTVGNTTWTVPANVTSVAVLVVAGGGGGGYDRAGGGGAGGLIYNSSYSVTPAQVISVTIGSGGTGGTAYGNATSGNNSVFGSLTANGGGYGGDGNGSSAFGGSGGGSGSGAGTARGAGTSGQGHDGGNPGGGTNGGGAGGGGGAGTVGGDGGASNGTGGNGGNGLSYSISGVATYYAGGGGAGSARDFQTPIAAGTGGLGGGGNGGDGPAAGGTAGTANTGGGGGGGSNIPQGPGGNGGSGVVILQYVSN